MRKKPLKQWHCNRGFFCVAILNITKNSTGVMKKEVIKRINKLDILKNFRLT